jgi:hypothetical protein
MFRRVHWPRSLDSVVGGPPWARMVTPSVLIATFSRCTPRTTIEAPGSAASTAPRIEPPGPTTKGWRPRAEPVKTILLMAGVMGAANSRADRRTRLPIALENRPRLSSKQLTKQAARPSRQLNVAPTQTRAGHARALNRSRQARPIAQLAVLPLRTCTMLKRPALARAICAAALRKRQRSHAGVRGYDLDLI